MNMLLENCSDIFAEDLQKTHKTASPPVSAEIDLVYVLSGRSTVLGEDADQLGRPFDKQDDQNRLAEGIRLAREISAKRLGIPVAELKLGQCMIPIFYNGRDIHNRALKTALKEAKIPYPAKLFIIKDINPPNTIGQVQSFIRFLQQTDLVVNNIAVVSSAYHLARVARTIGMDSPHVSKFGNMNVLGAKNIYLYGTDKNYEAHGIVLDLLGEYGAMRNYSSGNQGKTFPTISRYCGRNTFFTASDIIYQRSFNMQLQTLPINSVPCKKNQEAPKRDFKILKL